MRQSWGGGSILCRRCANQKLKGAMAPLREPNKLQRLGEAVVTSLPYHPEYIDQGTVFDTALLEPVSLLT